MTEKGRQVTQFLLLLAINYSFCDYWPPFEAMVKDQGLLTFTKSTSGKEIYYSTIAAVQRQILPSSTLL